MNPKIIFLEVRTNQEKLICLTKIIQKHFELNDKILVIVPTDDVAKYIDQLIWRLPEDSFIPHIVSNVFCEERVVISTKLENLNKANVLINLSQDVNSICHEFLTVYELYDLTHPSKEELSRAKYSGYGSQGFQLSVQTSAP